MSSEWTPRQGRDARRATARWLLVAVAACATGPACSRESPEERRARIQRELRAERLARARRRKLLLRSRREAQARYYKELQASLHPVAPRRPNGTLLDPWGLGQPVGGPRVGPSGDPTRPCDPIAALTGRLRRGSQLWDPSVERVLTSLSTHRVRLGRRTYQRFGFLVRMHPADEPRLGRRAARPVLVLRLAAIPLCPRAQGVVGGGSRRRTIHLRLSRRPAARGRTRPVRAILVDRRAPPRSIPVATPVEILVDSTTPGRRNRHRGGRAIPRTPERRRRVGGRARRASLPPGVIWRLVDARFLGRPRTARLHVQSFLLGHRLSRLAAVEVPCPTPIGRCRFLTRSARDGAEHVLPIRALVKRATPVRTSRQARQLFAILRTLRYFRCTSRGKRPNPLFDHPCLHAGKPYLSQPCVYYRATNGYHTRQSVRRVKGQWIVRQALRCELPGGLRVLRVEARFGPQDSLHLVETDLTARAEVLEDRLQQIRAHGK